MKIPRFFLAGLEQILLGITSFSVTWLALRTLNYESFSIFSIYWAIAWGGLAVLSEFLVSPNRVQALELGNFKPLTALAAVTGLSALLALFLGLFTFPQIQLALLSTALLLAAVAFQSLRSVLQVAISMRSTLLCFLLLFLNSSALGMMIVTQTEITEGRLLASSAAAHLGSLAIMYPYRSARVGLVELSRNALRLALRFGSGFGLSTLVRVLTYSITFLLLVGVFEGSLGLAVFASATALIAPSQILTAALSWTLFPKIVMAAKEGVMRQEIGKQVTVYCATGLALCAGLSIVWPSWVSWLVVEEKIQTQVLAQPAPVLLLMFFAVLSAFPSSAFHAIRAQKQQFWISLASGVLGLCLLIVGVQAILASALTYAAYSIVAILTAIYLSRNVRGHE
jgi:O-antigen/teichoic acid export membrane protein